jgi:hypothetical protein
MQRLCSLLAFAFSAPLAGQELITDYGAANSYGLNTFVGFNSGNSTMSPGSGPSYLASRNTAVGVHSFSRNQTGFENIAVSANALHFNRNGYHNTAVGYVCLASNVSGIDNTAFGHSAMYYNVGGVENTAVGLHSLYRNTFGNHNVAIGRDANYSNTTGNWNTGLGVDAIPGVETGQGNTSAGGESGYTEFMSNQCVTGNYNTWLGYQSGPSSPAEHDYVIGLGHRAKTGKDWQAVFGSPQTAETLLHGNVGINATDPAATLVVMGDAVNMTGVWDVYSDVRLKDDVRSYEDGLDVVLQLNPVTFTYNGLEGLPKGEHQIGLLAQQVAEVAPYMISITHGRDLEDVHTMSPQALPYLLVNAFRDLHAQLTAMQDRVAELETDFD